MNDAYQNQLLNAWRLEQESIADYAQMLDAAPAADKATLQEILTDEEDHAAKISAILLRVISE
jgi:rubrerythrin